MTSNILVVDDETSNRNAIQRLFEEYDFRFIEAANGQEALRQLAEHDIDLILLDIRMPIMDGFEFLYCYLDSEPKFKPPICVMTAIDDKDTRRQAIYLGADDFIIKPIDTIELETRVASLIRISHQQRDLNTLKNDLKKKMESNACQSQKDYQRLIDIQKSNALGFCEVISRLCRLIPIAPTNHKVDAEKICECILGICESCNIHYEKAANLGYSALLFNIGMLQLKDTVSESSDILMGDRLGDYLFSHSDHPLLRNAYNIYHYHDRAFNDDDFPLVATLFTIAQIAIETFEKKPSTDPGEIKNILKCYSGSRLDPSIVNMVIGSGGIPNSIVKIWTG